MKKTLLLLALLVLCLVVTLVSCGDSSQDTTTTVSSTSDEAPATAEEVRILALKGPTDMGLANVLHEAQNASESRYKYQIHAGPDLVKTEYTFVIFYFTLKHLSQCFRHVILTQYHQRRIP